MSADLYLSDPFVSIIFKATVLLLAATITSWFLRKRSAALRHLVWVGCAAGLLLLPVLSAVLPSWTVSLTAADSEFAPVAHSTTSPRPVDLSEAPTAMGSSQVSAREPDFAGGTQWIPRPTVISVFGWLWVSGMVVLLFIRLCGDVRVSRIRRQCRWAEAVGAASHLRALMLENARRIGLNRPPALLIGSETTLPFTGGLWRPFVVVPESATRWNEEKQRSVLLHELAHVERRDCLTQGIGHCARAVFWFHPLAWWMTYRMRVDREQACDDRVLETGQSPARYARVLLDLVKEANASAQVPHSALAMARRSTFEGRLLAVLDARRKRRGLDRRMVAGSLILVAGLTLSLAMVQTVIAEAEEETGSGETGSTPGTVAMLENGFSVEILAVGDRLAEPVAWWLPDGGEIGMVPPYRERTGISVREASGQWEFALMLRDPEGVEPGFKVRLPDLEEGYEMNQWTQAGSLYGTRRWSVVGNLPGDLLETDVHIGIAAGEWKTVAVSGPVESASFGEGETLADGERFAFAPVARSDEGVVTSVAYNVHHSNDQLRIVAVDNAGGVHPSSESASVGTPSWQTDSILQQMTVTIPNVSTGDLREFQIQSRPYRWIAFRNVSLSPGHRTEVRVGGAGGDEQAGYRPEGIDSVDSEADEIEKRMAEQQVELAEQLLRRQWSLFENGRATSVEVTEAELNLLGAREHLARMKGDDAELRMLAERRVELMEFRLNAVRAWLEAGRATESEALEAEIALREARMALRELLE